MLWWADDTDHEIAMLTLTIRHAYVHDLRRLRFGLTTCWSELWRTREGRELRERFGHYVRALDITWGPDHGWHPHLHVLLFANRGDLDDTWLDRVRSAWAHMVELYLGREFRPRTDSVGVHLTHDPPRAEYVLKLGLEVGQITSKQAAPGHLTSWQIGQRAVDEQSARTTDRHWRNLWRSWVTGMLGARHLTWSRDVRRLASLPEDHDPEQLALDFELAEDDGWILSITAPDWRAVFGNHSIRRAWTFIRRPSVLLGRTRGGLDKTLDYLRHVGLDVDHVRKLAIDGRPYRIVVMRRRTSHYLKVVRC
jgi:hypothetical protein